MAVEVFWDDTLEGLVYFKFISPWSWDEYIQVTTKELASERSKQALRYDVIGDLLESTGLPSGASTTHVAAMFRLSPPNVGLTIAVTNSSLIRILINVFVKIYPQRRAKLFAVSTVAEAYEHIRQDRMKQK
jgi:hypothetical protein